MYLPPKKNADAKTEVLSSFLWRLWHFPYKKRLLVVGLGTEKRLSIALWPMNYSRQVERWIPGLTSRKKSTNVIQNSKEEK